MESIGNQGNTELVTAEELRNLTISEEEKRERDRRNVKDNMMSSMVRLASENGALEYTANLAPQFDSVLLTTIVDDFKELGYKTEVKKEKNDNFGEYIALKVSWADQAEQSKTDNEQDAVN